MAKKEEAPKIPRKSKGKTTKIHELKLTMYNGFVMCRKMYKLWNLDRIVKG